MINLFGNGNEGTMNTMEILTLLLVAFSALTYIDNLHNHQK